MVGGERREVLEALREGGPTKREGAGRRFDVVLVIGVVGVIVLPACCIFTCLVVEVFGWRLVWQMIDEEVAD